MSVTLYVGVNLSIFEVVLKIILIRINKIAAILNAGLYCLEFQWFLQFFHR